MSPPCLHNVTQRTLNNKNYTAEQLKTKQNKTNKKFGAFHMRITLWTYVLKHGLNNCSLTKSNVNLKRKKNL